MHRGRWSQTNGWLYGTIAHRPSSPAILIYTRSETIFILCGAAFFGCMDG